MFDSFDPKNGSISAAMLRTSQCGVEGSYRLEGKMDAESLRVAMQVDQRMPGVPSEGRVRMEMRVPSQRFGDCV